MSYYLARTVIFQDYPDVRRYLDRYDRGRIRCCVTVGNEGFIVDVYRAKYPNKKGTTFA